MNKNLLFLACSIALAYNSYGYKKNSGTAHTGKDEKFRLTDTQLNLSTKDKKDLQRRLSLEEFSQILDELALLRQQNREYADRIVSYEQTDVANKAMLDKLQKDYQNMIAEYEKKLEDASGNGDIARKALLDEIRTKGIDKSKLRFRVQIGEMSTYKAAQAVKNRARDLGLDTWILPVYKGYVIPLKDVTKHIN